MDLKLGTLDKIDILLLDEACAGCTDPAVGKFCLLWCILGGAKAAEPIRDEGLEVLFLPNKSLIFLTSSRQTVSKSGGSLAGGFDEFVSGFEGAGSLDFGGASFLCITAPKLNCVKSNLVIYRVIVVVIKLDNYLWSKLILASMLALLLLISLLLILLLLILLLFTTVLI
jgi:hypothetical protein